ncbi:serine/threonine-protein phosphatase [candidate division WOR-3 bacterium]|nr:serine/threonine-protein phosphatase [candidate division WOR-3 bacterium]
MSRINLNYKSVKGSKTSRNEDVFTWVSVENQNDLERKGALFIVVDGFGGRSDAPVSSEYVAREIIEKFYTDETSRTTKERLVQTLKEINGKFYRDWKERNDRKGVGASVSILVVKSHSVSVANIGDSKVYLLRDRTLKMVSKDFSWSAEQDKGQGKDRTMRNILTGSVGSRPVIEPEVFSVNIKQGDLFLMTSDGVTDFIDDGEIREACLYRYSEELPGVIISTAVKGGSDDDATAAVIKFSEVPVQHSDVPERRLTLTLNSEDELEPIQTDDETTEAHPDEYAADETGKKPRTEKENRKKTKKERSFNIKILYALIPFVLLILAVIFNPFNFLQRKKPVTNGTVNQGDNSQNIVNSSASSDSFYRIDIVNVSKIAGTATKAQILISNGIDSIFDSLAPGVSYAILNGYGTDTFISSLNLFSVPENSVNSMKILDLFEAIFPDSLAPTVRTLHLVIETGDDLVNTGNFLPDTSALEDFDIDTLNVCIITRYPDDTLATRLFRSLDKAMINRTPIRIVAVIESPDTAQKNQTRILSSEKNLRIARSLAHSMGLRDDFYVWNDSTSRFIFLLNKNLAAFIQ